MPLSCLKFLNVFLQETVKVFLKHPSVKDDSDLEGRTSFMWAAGKGNDDVLRTMLSLKSDIDINMADKYGGTGKNWQTYSAFIQDSEYRWCYNTCKIVS